MSIAFRRLQTTARKKSSARALYQTHSDMKKTLVLCATCVGLLSGCFLPEKFSAKVEVNADQSYSFAYKGTAREIVIAADIAAKKAKDSDDKVVSYVNGKLKSYKSSPMVKSVSYQGNGVFDLELGLDKKPGESLSAFDSFKIYTKDVAGKKQMVVSSPTLTAKDLKSLKELGITMDGTLNVSVPSNMVVVSHNATGTPTLGFGSYSWKIGGLGEGPRIVLQLKG